MWNEFVELAKDKFSFLETELGFISKSIREPFFIFESTKTRVSVYYEVNRRFELDLSIGRLEDDPRSVPPVGISEMMLVAGVKETDVPMAEFPSGRKELENEMDKLIKIVKKNGFPFLLGEPKSFERVKRLRKAYEEKINKRTP